MQRLEKAYALLGETKRHGMLGDITITRRLTTHIWVGKQAF